MDAISIIYLLYMFVSLYMLSFFLILYFKNISLFYDYPVTEKKYSISFLVPAYNEEKTIIQTLEHILAIEYDYIEEIIVLNDGSKDNTAKLVKEFIKDKPLIKLLDKLNSGKADSLNKGIAMAKGELVAVVDADSYPYRDSIKKMVGFFDNPKVGAVTVPILARDPKTFWEKMQSIEYQVITFTRKLLEYVDAIYVTPGPLALYRKTALNEVGGFDPSNMTEDIELTWRLAYHGWERKMALGTGVTSTVPRKLKPWFIQRRRWSIGGLQTTMKYWKTIGRRGMLGKFILPFFIFGFTLGLVGLGIFGYIFGKRIISNYLWTRYSFVADTPMLTIDQLYITLSFLNYLGLVLFIAGLIFTIAILIVLKDKVFKRENLLNIPFYSTIYLVLYPIILINSLWHFMRGKYVWR